MGRHLFITETPSIKKYVFGTDKLKEMVGASIILNELNIGKTEEVLKNALGKNRVKKVYANGGSGQFILSDCDEKDIECVGQKLECLYTENTKGGANLLWAYAPYSSPENEYQEALELAYYNMIVKRESQSFLWPPVHMPYYKDCKSCSNGIATIKSNEEDDEWLCEVCNSKRKSSKNLGLWRDLCKYLKKATLTYDECIKLRPNDFQEIGAFSRKLGYIGVVYADGNSMSKHIKSIDTNDNFKSFSDIIDNAIKKACFHALEKYCSEERGVIPAQILILGGDDLVVVLPADRAMDFALSVADKFTEITKNKFLENEKLSNLFNGQGITISTGVAIGKDSQPFRILLEQAEGLLKLAKEKGAEKDGGNIPDSYIDFHISSQSAWVDINVVRNEEYVCKKDNLFRTMRPYSLEDAKKLLENARKLSNLPRTKLQKLYDSAFLNKGMAQLETIRVFTRLKEKENERMVFREAIESFDCFKLMPWKKENDVYKTMIPDVVELIDFVRTEE